MKYIIFLSFLLLIPISSPAEIHIEPYGSIGGSYSSFSSRPLFVTYALGGRVGYRFPLITAGMDVFFTHHSTGSNKTNSYIEIHRGYSNNIGLSQAEKTVSFNYSELPAHFQPFAIGAFASMDLPFIFNVYGTLFYAFGKKNNVQHQGFGVKGGLSYLSVFYLQLNLELQYAYYHCMEKVMCFGNFSTISALLSLSVPLSSDILNFGVDSSDDSLEEEETETSI